jgi:hypothetical protein
MFLAPLAADSGWKAQTINYRPYAQQIFSILQMWPAAYIPCCTPFIGGLIVGPAAMNLRVAMECRNKDGAGRSRKFSSNAEVDLLKLWLIQQGRFWNIGNVYLGMIELMTWYTASLIPDTVQILPIPSHSRMARHHKRNCDTSRSVVLPTISNGEDTERTLTEDTNELLWLHHWRLMSNVLPFASLRPHPSHFAASL